MYQHNVNIPPPMRLTAQSVTPPAEEKPPVKATFRPVEVAPECCVHVLADTLSGINAQNPAKGRLDCPTNDALHEQEVMVFSVEPDGQGGMKALIRAPGHSVGATTAAPDRVLPVCTVGPQDKEPVDCCIQTAPDGTQVVICEDADHELHGKPAEVAVKLGHTLQTCPPPPDLPSCCVELGSFSEGGESYNARLVCDDTSHAAHGKLINVHELSDDKTRAAIRVGRQTVVLPVCEIEEVPEEIPCCIRDGKLYCPDHPDYHDMPYAEFQADTGSRLEACPDLPPPTPVPPDCCVQLGDPPIMICSDIESPWHGYELKDGQWSCNEEEGWCMVALERVTETGSEVIEGKFPLCAPPPPEPLPPDCCYDVATGTLICSDADSEWHNLKVSLEDLVSGGPNGPMWAVVSHAKLGSAVRRFPVCEGPVPEDCCFEAAEAKAGAVGKLVCTSTSALNGMQAILTDVNEFQGALIATVSWAGGGARVPFCRPPAEECPECPPPYFCCVNLDTGTFVCPAHPEKNGQPADVAGVESINGMPFARLADRTMVPACGTQCPAPEPCPECPKCPKCPVCPKGEECPGCPECPPPGPCPECPGVGLVPKTPDCAPTECSQPPYGTFTGTPTGMVPGGGTPPPCCP